MIRVGRLFKSFGYAVKGLVKTFREEQNLQIQTLASLVVLSLGVYFEIEAGEWLVLILVICLVLVAEIANSAVERITDVLKPRINSYVKEIKDIMAAAVLLSSLAAIIVGAIIFWPHLYKLFGQL
ncbi:diacylglycerol kinase family protein [Candidatus Falkowbacteria bacterium]|nr:diacylglycerol kinase family protein [Candidatus Falkowbacteria bacterium]